MFPISMQIYTVVSLIAAAIPALTCDSCYGPRDGAAHVRNVRRQQPSAQNATDGPKGKQLSLVLAVASKRKANESAM